ncbi:hypothetical protein BJX66DRAFT_336276 [Aspergillus keveii]|uniref:FAD-binding domain-containing protein n=1 Tax=Aspergillus keveii TaxID=714993 RepID=A0ABR4GB69_9EURO
MAPPRAPHVLIVGSGLTGLALAQSLKKAGISYQIFEKASVAALRARPRDWGITLHWGSALLHDCLPLEITSNLRSAQVNQRVEYTENEAVTVVNTATGVCLKTIPLGHAGRFSHRKLLSLLEGGIDYEKEVEKVTASETGPGVTIAFTDGSDAHGDLVVGADGRHSFMRGLLLGEETASQQFEPLGLVMHNFVAQYDEAQSQFILSRLHRFLDMGVNPNGIFFALVPLDIPAGTSLDAAKFQIFISYASDPSKEDTSDTDILIDLKGKSQDFAEPFRSAIAWLNADHVIHTGNLYGMKIPSWDNRGGRVTLAGDAAHPFPPHRGQAINHALQDVYNITQACLEARETGDLPDAIAQFDTELVTRANAEMELSVWQSKMMHDWDALMQSPLMTIGARKVDTGHSYSSAGLAK